MMVKEDIKSTKRDLLCEKNVFKIENYNPDSRIKGKLSTGLK